MGEDCSFELSGGELCLDFANTWGDRERAESDQLGAPGDLVRFARETGLLDEAGAACVEAGIEDDRDRAAETLAVARELREVLFRLFSAVARGTEIACEDVRSLGEAVAPALAHLRIAPGADGFDWVWDEPPGSLEALLRPILRSAGELLTSRKRLPRVRVCDGSSCTWLFLDESRNRSRRWCSMEVCGNRAKARRHYRRQRRNMGAEGT